jgi:hypothetical protein
VYLFDISISSDLFSSFTEDILQDLENYTSSLVILIPSLRTYVVERKGGAYPKSGTGRQSPMAEDEVATG